MSTSWIIVDKATGKPVLETFQSRVAEKVNTVRYEVWPALAWLQELNVRIKAGDERYFTK